MEMPPDIHESLWDAIRDLIARGDFAVTEEILQEMIMIDGGLGRVDKRS